MSNKTMIERRLALDGAMDRACESLQRNLARWHHQMDRLGYPPAPVRIECTVEST